MDPGGWPARRGRNERARLTGLAARAGRDPRALAVACVAGVLGVYLSARAPSPAWLILPLAICLRRFPGRGLCVIACIAAAWTAIGVQHQLAGRLPVARSGDIVWVTGRIDGLVMRQPVRSRFVLATDGRRPRRLRLSWYENPPALLPGDCLRLKVKLFAPHGSADAGSFDYEAWLWRERIDATGYVRAAGECDLAPAMGIDRLRALALRRLDSMLAGQPMRGVVEALTFGARGAITDAQWQVLRATGTSHLVAISGLHIGLIALWLFVLSRAAVVRLPGRIRAERVAAGAAFAGALAYALLAGLSLPTQRALIMTAAALTVYLARWEIAPSRALALAAIAVVFWHPAAVIAPGFWLSFGAVAWLLYLARPGRRWRWMRLGGLQLALVAGLVPLTLWFFEQASLIAPLVNAVLIPLAGVVVPVLLLVTLLALAWSGIGGPLLVGCARLLELGWRGLANVSAWPISDLHAALPGIAALILALGGLALLVMPRGLLGRWLGAVLLLPAVIGWHAPGDDIKPGAYRVTVLDVGQGLSVVVRTRGHTLVYDAGPVYRTGFDTGAAIVVPYLRHVGRPLIDRLVISHADIDHMGGAGAIERTLTVRARLGAGGARDCRAGQHWRWDGVDFLMLYPDRTDRAWAPRRNDRSCVLRIAGAGGRTLLTGDIEADAERRLVARERARVAADVLVVAHHGSATSSSPAFLAAVAPSLALISAGWHNRWGFPAPMVLARLHRAGARVTNTADSGALTVRVPGRPNGRLRLSARRRTHARLWQLP